MSYPISYCLVAKAANGDEEAYKTLSEAMYFNLMLGHFSQFPCSCDPKCYATDDALKAVDARLKVDVYDKLQAEILVQRAAASGDDRGVEYLMTDIKRCIESYSRKPRT